MRPLKLVMNADWNNLDERVWVENTKLSLRVTSSEKPFFIY